ncbi:MAG TPA: dihydropteroate synthase [Chthoniobacterales bacterium]|nr:dihydropteroate synthase [Chthoniobacterales bacterium]
MGERLWKIGDKVVDLSKRGMTMGVLNVTPDSFSDGGEFFATDAAVAGGIEMATEGADIIDVGGESTRPGAEPISVKEELKRAIPVIEKLRAKIDIPISIDTSKSEVASAALDAGASIINDVTAGRGDKKILPLAAKRKAAIVLMHMQGEPRTMQENPRYKDVVAEVADFFRQQYARALDCGIDPMTLAFDPGIGFGKTLEHNLALLKNLERLRVHNRPLVVGVSRKSFLEKLIGSSEMSDRLAPTIALTAILRGWGADMLRVHDVKENVAALRAAEALLS